MRTETPRQIRLVDYRAPAFVVDEVSLDFSLEPSATRVRTRLALRRSGAPGEPLRLDGERLRLVSVAIDGQPLGPDRYQVTADSLVIADAPDAFLLETEVEIDPSGNTALEGLYMSGGRFCTQCEAEGFRTITYYPDRPDVLSRFTVRMDADKARFPRLLSNGNLMETGDLAGGRHYAVWNDPHPKPAYLFALVAGELDVLEDRFTTMSGREVELKIYVDPGMADRAAYAMDSLKRSMKWDEEAYGREYDLDLFMIVAVRDFNAGAMENKGLNIFNASLLLADPSTATDFDYSRIEAVVAHEYFHNWSGNRITCRDWFQLCLKEGFTVLRDQGFSADMRGEAVQRIKEVRTLRARQFAEDAGPLAHPVRPSSFVKIDNFYTATVYEKGAEIARMIRTLLGPEDFRRGSDLYFERWDGTAATVEQFVESFANASGQDLSHLFAWYEQAGTPELTVTSAYDAEAQALDLNFAQETAPTPGQPDKLPLPIPVRLGLMNENGAPLSFTVEDGPQVTEAVVLADEATTTVRLHGVASRPVLSLLRGFSAPVNLKSDASDEDGFLQLAADPDLFNRWEAGQTLARKIVIARAQGAPDADAEARYVEAVGRALADPAADPAFKALLLPLPSEAELAIALAPGADPARINEARESIRASLARGLRAQLESLHDELTGQGTYSPDAESAGRRALANTALYLLTATPDAQITARAVRHFEQASNMTDAMAGLGALSEIGGEPFEQALEQFYNRWKSEPLVVDKWFAMQAGEPSPGALGRVLGLTVHPAFDPKNPNRLRSLVVTFTGNAARFHDPSGAGYRFLADQIIATDPINPVVASRILEPLTTWRRYTPQLAELMKAELRRILESPGLSKNVQELVGKALDGG